MTVVVAGGLRARLIHDSLFEHIRAGLTGLGWFDTGRRHQPVTMIGQPQDWNQPIKANTLVVVTDHVGGEELELGSNLTLDDITVTVDFIAENDSVGIELINDARDILRGRLGPRSTNTVPVIDFRQPTPGPIGYVTVEDVSVAHGVVPTQKAWQRFWYGLEVRISDTYMAEGRLLSGPYPDAELYPAFDLYPGS